MTTLIAWSGFNPPPGHLVLFLDKTLYDDYSAGWLQKSSKYLQKHWISGNSLVDANFSKHEVVFAIKYVQIIKQLASNAVRWQEAYTHYKNNILNLAHCSTHRKLNIIKYTKHNSCKEMQEVFNSLSRWHTVCWPGSRKEGSVGTSYQSSEDPKRTRVM